MANPRLFQGQMSARHERRIRKAFREAKQQRMREKLQQEAREWTAQWKASRTFTPVSQKVFNAFARTASEEDKQALFEIARERQREIAKPLPPQPAPLTGEQITIADSTLAFLGREIERANSLPEPHRPAGRFLDFSTDRTEPPREEPRGGLDIERQPDWRLRRLEYQERVEANTEHARDLIRRYELDRQHPTVQGLTLRRKRR